MLHELVDDRAGNLTRQTDNAANRAKHMSYDHANRVTRVTNPATGETVGRYHYDDQGFRVRKIALDDDGVDRKEARLLNASMYFGVEIQKDVYTGEEIYTVLNNIYLNGVRVAAMVPTGEAGHFHTDQVDSVKVVTNDAGAVVSRMEYLPYGESWFREGDDRFAPKYNSQELDRESGYYFYNARHYDPEICRFVTADTVIDGEFDTQGWNRFAYVKGNPIRYKDPTGHTAFKWLDDAIDTTLKTVHEVADYNDKYHSQKTEETLKSGNLPKYLYNASSAIVSKAAKLVSPKNHKDVEEMALGGALGQQYKGILNVGQGADRVINKLGEGKTKLTTDSKNVTHLIDSKTGKYVEPTAENLKAISPLQKAEIKVGKYLGSDKTQLIRSTAEVAADVISPSPPNTKTGAVISALKALAGLD